MESSQRIVREAGVCGLGKLEPASVAISEYEAGEILLEVGQVVILPIDGCIGFGVISPHIPGISVDYDIC